MKIFLSITFFFIFLTAQSNNNSAPKSQLDPFKAYNYCKQLSSKEFAGRLTGHEGYTKAAQWAADKFKEWGLLPASKQFGYLQPYPSPYTIIEDADMKLYTGANKQEIQLQKPKDYLPVLFADNCDITTGIVFVGWGISAAESGYDDYAGVDVKGKFVMCFRGTPDNDKKYQYYDEHRTRMQTAKEKGAVGLIYIYDDPIAMPNGDWISEFSPVILDDNTADKILKEHHFTSAELRKKLLADKKTLSFITSSSVSLKIKSSHFKDATGYNVVGYIEGSDPVLKNECLVYGAHFDFCGEHMGLFYPGSNDNGSGSAVVIRLAEMFSELKIKPKRSVAFVLFGGEEMGLMGSRYYTDNMPAKLNKVDAMINFDMVGHGDKAWCSLSENPAAFKDALLNADKNLNILAGTGVIKNIGVRSSDFAPFFLKGSTVASFSSNGPHQFYHLLGDNIYRINPDILNDIANLSFNFGSKWADR